MKGKTPTAAHPDADSIRARLLRGIAGNRVAGLHFPGYFLDIEWAAIGGDSANIAIAGGPHCSDANGEVDITALAILADTVLATTARLGIKPGARLATIHLQMQFTGAPAIGRISAEGRLLGLSAVSSMRQSLSSAELYAQGKLVCHTSGEFVLLDPPAGVKLAPLPWQSAAPTAAATVDEGTLEPLERVIVQACDEALSRAPPHSAFVQHFWGAVPRRTAAGASSRIAIGPHLSNRVGHVQGGILFGIAANTARAAVPAEMVLSNASAWYISPGRGKALRVQARVVHAGRSLAVIRTEIKTSGGERVLEVVTQHVARGH